VGNFFGKFKKKFNYMLKTIHNEDYWAMNLQGKATFHLLHLFNKNSYDAILDFMGSKLNDLCLNLVRMGLTLVVHRYNITIHNLCKYIGYNNFGMY
jgi:hypothetical protein